MSHDFGPDYEKRLAEQMKECLNDCECTETEKGHDGPCAFNPTPNPPDRVK